MDMWTSEDDGAITLGFSGDDVLFQITLSRDDAELVRRELERALTEPGYISERA